MNHSLTTRLPPVWPDGNIIFQFLDVCIIESFGQGHKNSLSRHKSLPNTKPYQTLPNDCYNFAKAVKYPQIWSHWLPLWWNPARCDYFELDCKALFDLDLEIEKYFCSSSAAAAKKMAKSCQ